jgi:O-succinylbenzoic acid--CoA ligase
VEAPGITACPLTTNDLIDLDANGRFRVKGRIDNIINTGGIKVSPEEVEEQIAHLMPGPFAVVAAHHETLGQQLVLITEQPLENPGELLKQIEILLPPYHAPRKLMVVNPLPRTQNGKIKRHLPL